ncbi:MAG: transcriptional regulator, partial [Gemmatimonadota bacterium]
RFPDAPEEHRDFWLVLERSAIDLCLKDPGYGWDLRVRSDVQTLTEVWLGDDTLGRVLKEGSIRLQGPEELRRAFPGWLGLSLFAGVERPPARRRA